MKLYLISQDKNEGYDTYDSAVVAAESAKEARSISPAGYSLSEFSGGILEVWAPIEDVVVKYIGETELPKGIVLASFNAG